MPPFKSILRILRCFIVSIGTCGGNFHLCSTNAVFGPRWSSSPMLNLKFWLPRPIGFNHSCHFPPPKREWENITTVLHRIMNKDQSFECWPKFITRFWGAFLSRCLLNVWCKENRTGREEGMAWEYQSNECPPWIIHLIEGLEGGWDEGVGFIYQRKHPDSIPPYSNPCSH